MDDEDLHAAGARDERILEPSDGRGDPVRQKQIRTWRGRKPEEYEKAKAERKAARAAKLANRKAEKEALRKKPGRPRVVDGAMVEDMIHELAQGPGRRKSAVARNG